MKPLRFSCHTHLSGRRTQVFAVVVQRVASVGQQSKSWNMYSTVSMFHMSLEEFHWKFYDSSHPIFNLILKQYLFFLFGSFSLASFEILTKKRQLTVVSFHSLLDNPNSLPQNHVGLWFSLILDFQFIVWTVADILWLFRSHWWRVKWMWTWG